jgi:predicted CDP-diglyceride synthetase/phosphatidate cytidylyltransferase
MYPVILFTCLIFIFIEGFTLLSGLLFSTSEPHSGQKSKGLLFTYAVSFIFVLLLRKELSGVGVNVGIRAFLILIFALIGRFFWILLKRKTEKRQFGSYIPGYGGVLDLFHSFIFAAAGTSILEFFR